LGWGLFGKFLHRHWTSGDEKEGVVKKSQLIIDVPAIVKAIFCHDDVAYPSDDVRSSFTWEVSAITTTEGAAVKAAPWVGMEAPWEGPVFFSSHGPCRSIRGDVAHEFGASRPLKERSRARPPNEAPQEAQYWKYD
jgi:hypothetical protein